MKSLFTLLALAALTSLSSCNKESTPAPSVVVYLAVEETRGEMLPVLASSTQLFLVPQSYTVIYTNAEGRQVHEAYPSQDALQFSKYIRVKPGFEGSVRLMDSANTTAKINVTINGQPGQAATGSVRYKVEDTGARQ